MMLFLDSATYMSLCNLNILYVCLNFNTAT